VAEQYKGGERNTNMPRRVSPGQTNACGASFEGMGFK